MGQHGPEPLQCLRWNARAELWHIPLQIGSDEALPQPEAIGIAFCEVAVGKTAADPQTVARRRVARRLQNIQRLHSNIFDSARQAFSRLPQQVDRCRPQDQETACPLPPPAALVDQAAQCLEQFRGTMNFIEKTRRSS